MTKPRKILIDLQHPAHLHFFKHLVQRLESEGCRVILTARNKDILKQLAWELNMDVLFFGTARKGFFNLSCELLYRQAILWRMVRSEKPERLLAIAGTFISLVGRLTGVPTHIFYDTEHATLSNLIAYPFATTVHVPRCYRKPIKRSHVRYNGYHELAYLHPAYFTPDPAILETVNLKPGDPFSLVRFVAWGAAHDIGLRGFTLENKRKAVKRLEQYGKVLISSEDPLPPELEPYHLTINVSQIHHLMAYASLIFGESATMCSEGAVLGIPGIYLDPIGRGYMDEQERDYGLVYNFKPKDQDQAIEKGATILAENDEKKWQAARNKLLEDKIDVTELLYQVLASRP